MIPDPSRFPAPAAQTSELQQARDARRAALNLMEDAIQSREAIGKLNNELRQSEQRLSRELAATRQLQSVSTLLIEGGDSQALYQKIVDAAAVIMRSDYASIQMYHPERGSGGELRLLAFRGFNPQAAKFWEWVRADSESTCGAALRTGKRVIASDVEKCEFMAGTDDLATYLRTGIHAVQTTPLVSRSGGLLGMISTHWRTPHTPAESDLVQLDVLARQAADLIERNRSDEALRRSESNLRDFIENASVGLHWVGPDGIVIWANQTELDLLGYAREDYIGRHIGDFHADQPAVEDILARLTRGETLHEHEARLRHKDGSLRHVLLSSNALFEGGGFVHTRCFTRDITERKQAEQRQLLLTNELAHRGKNLLAVVQSIAARSLSGKRSLDEARQVLTRRIQALSRSHSVLLNEGFEGAPIAEIVRLEFEVFPDRVDAVGPAVMLNSKTAQTFALLVHELATNAAKYGALSRPDGRVGMAWSVEGAGDDARFRFRWQERDGPAVTPPTHQGFGRILIEKVVAQDFETQPKLRFDPAGFSYEIDAPLSAVLAPVSR